MPDAVRNLEAIFRRSANPMLITDDARRFVDGNPAACRMLGMSVEELRARTIDEMTPESLRPSIDELWPAFMADGVQVGSFEFQRPDGGVVSFEYSATANIEPGRHLGILMPDSDGAGDNGTEMAAGPLSERERQVLEELALGATLEEAGERLSVSPETVRTHAGNARAKLGARNRAHAIALALRDGLIAPPR
jgi:PAS domain S-box-containing protein